MIERNQPLMNGYASMPETHARYLLSMPLCVPYKIWIAIRYAARDPTLCPLLNPIRQWLNIEDIQ